ncbi:hypothetical protein FRC11_010422 [Ceratobasidium sp. 423]|nr:hypothetical protein FRC11_010422 [Ceratobasidium sp. 423]
MPIQYSPPDFTNLRSRFPITRRVGPTVSQLNLIERLRQERRDKLLGLSPHSWAKAPTVSQLNLIERLRQERRDRLLALSPHSGVKSHKPAQFNKRKRPLPTPQTNTDPYRPRIRPRGRTPDEERQTLPPPHDPIFAPIAVTIDDDDGELRQVTEEDRLALKIWEFDGRSRESIMEFRKAQCSLVSRLVSEVVKSKAQTHNKIQRANMGTAERMKEENDLTFEIRCSCAAANYKLKKLQGGHLAELEALGR